MPLYARTEKRIRRKEREDELGITAVKDAMKENGELEGSSDEDGDLDDESESDIEDEDEGSEIDGEEEDGDEEDSEDEDGEEGGLGADGDADSDDAEDDDEDSASDDGADEPFPLTIDEVESNPIYPMDDNEGCLLCPGKTLKNPKMKETHLASTSHKRAMRRWTTRLAQVDERPLPSDDPRDVMNEILDDLEDQRAGQATASVSAPPQQKKESKKRTLPEGETETTPSSAKKAKKAGKSQRKAEKALKAIESAKAGDGQQATGKSGDVGTGPGTGTGAKGLNRKARRLLAHKQKEAEGKGKVVKDGTGATAVKEKKGDRPSSVLTGEQSSKKASKKNRKST